jgi:hypothetical protein
MKTPRVSEKAEQAHGVQLLRGLGGKVYVIGHPSPNDGRRHRGTGQTPGLADVLAFLPPRTRFVDTVAGSVELEARTVLVFWEAKASGGRLRPEQVEFRALCQDAAVEHVVGDLDALIAWLVSRHYVKAESFPHYRQHEAVR